MKTLQSLCIATALASGLLLGVVGPAAAADPFDKSDQRCKSISTLHCAQLVSGTGPATTIGEMAAELGVPFKRVLKLNDWSSDDISPESVIPPDKQFALYGRS